jgi:hypothetical protein
MRKFEIKKEHLKLLQKAIVEWDDCEFGAPAINPKRPYGNSGVIQDIIEILGVTELKHGIYEFTLFDKKYLLKGDDKYNLDLENENELVQQLNFLHQSVEIALPICLNLQKFEIGIYRQKEDYNTWDWVKVK